MGGRGTGKSWGPTQPFPQSSPRHNPLLQQAAKLIQLFRGQGAFGQDIETSWRGIKQNLMLCLPRSQGGSATRHRRSRHSSASASRGLSNAAVLGPCAPGWLRNCRRMSHHGSAHKIPNHRTISPKKGKRPLAISRSGFTAKPKRMKMANRATIQVKSRLAHFVKPLRLRCTVYDSVKSFWVSSYSICMAAAFCQR